MQFWHNAEQKWKPLQPFSDWQSEHSVQKDGWLSLLQFLESGQTEDFNLRIDDTVPRLQVHAHCYL